MIPEVILSFLITKGVGNSVIRKLTHFIADEGVQTTTELFDTPFNMVRYLNIPMIMADSIRSNQSYVSPLKRQLEENNVGILWADSSEYPDKLNSKLDNEAPTILFYKGNSKLLSKKSVGFCGSRRASEKGIEVTKRCVEQLVDHEISIISGYAHGIDMASHKTALINGGTTVIILAEGILQYRVKREVAEYLNETNHLVISQFTPSLPWYAHNAMIRNKTIIGLSDAMILVESGLDGGTFAAGEDTLKNRTPLYVIDFADPGPTAAANPYFISKGGIPIRGKNGIPNLSALFETMEKRNHFAD